VRDGDHWVINGMKRWNSQVARAHGNLSSRAPPASRATPRASPPSSCPPTRRAPVLYNHWTFNMPSDHAEVELKNVRVPDSAILHRKARA
jgi:acyl-CoA dehydrogenase